MGCRTNTNESEILPFTEEGVKAFLAGGYVNGIGNIYAHKLVETYGLDTVATLMEKPEKIKGIPGLGPSRTEQASESLRKCNEPLDLLQFLYSAGVPEMYIERIIGKYRKKAKKLILEDPYSMVEDVWRLSFFTAYKIGKALGIPADDLRRLRGAVLTAVKHYAENGHLYATHEEAIKYASEITGVDLTPVSAVVGSLVADDRLIESRGGLYLPVYYEAEKSGAHKLMALASRRVEYVDPETIPATDIQGHTYSEEQRKAICTALAHPVSVVTGGPGSGKTTVLKGILDSLTEAEKKFILAAPTGKSAKRMSTLTGHAATTIHRLLGYRLGEGYYRKQIEADVLIIDEGSMLEQVLFNHLLQAVGPSTKIIITGDVDQLPAIGAGDVMRELIKSGMVPVVTLNENFRQSEGCVIAANARSINQGRMVKANTAEEFVIVNEKGPTAIRNRILSLVAEELPIKFGMRPEEIMVVTPQQLGTLGARELNIDLQQRLNPSGPEIKRGMTTMRLGDPVMQTANSRNRNLFNGEAGRIVAIDPDGKALTVEFTGGHRSVYLRSELSELVLAYATTVHKLQGSEVDYMVMPVTMAHRPMLYRNLLYTGVSRARKQCVLVGEEEAIRYAIDNNRETSRNSNFSSRLREEKRRGTTQHGNDQLSLVQSESTVA